MRFGGTNLIVEQGHDLCLETVLKLQAEGICRGYMVSMGEGKFPAELAGAVASLSNRLEDEGSVATA